MDKAEERALEAYPVKIETFYEPDIHYKTDTNAGFRQKFFEGYRQAEKDLALTWEDMRNLHIIFDAIDVDIELGASDINKETTGYYKEALRRFNEYKQKAK